MAEPLALKTTLDRLGKTLAALAGDVGVSRSAISQLVHHQRWPATTPQPEMRQRIQAVLGTYGATADEIAGAFDNTPATPAMDAAAPPVLDEEEIKMFVTKQSLTQAARKHFSLFRDPFAEVQDVADMWMGDGVRYVRETIYDTARNGGFRVVIGESGSGKSTLRQELEDRINRERLRVQIIEPYVLGLEDSETKGTPLRSMAIAEAIISKLVPTEPKQQSPQLRFAQAHRALIESRRAGNTNLLQIEEAHSLPISTLKHLKRFAELRDGLAPVLGIILYGQTELAKKLDGTNAAVREVTQRAEIVTLAPLDNDLGAYIAHRFDRVGAKLEKIMDESALDAISQRLMPDLRVRRGNREVAEAANLRYPLAVHNLLTAAMNEAAYLGAPIVTADIIRGC